MGCVLDVVRGEALGGSLTLPTLPVLGLDGVSLVLCVTWMCAELINPPYANGFSWWILLKGFKRRAFL